MNKYRKSIRLSSDNGHLLDIFSEHLYIEIGNIEFKFIKKLLTNQVVELNEFVDFNIQSIGLGKSKVSDEGLAYKMPYFFLQNLNEENPSYQFFLTYGLIAYENKDNKELFAPLVLLPLRLFYEEEKFSIILDAKPLANTILLNYLKPKGLNLTNEKLENLNDFLRFSLAVANYYKTKLRFESYFTLAKTTLPPIVVNHERFTLNKNIKRPLNNILFNERYDAIAFTKVLSYRQRQVIERAYYGNSFAIVGPIASGKTTSLLSMALIGLEKNQKVLYLSAQKKSIEEFETKLKELNLNNSYVNLTKPPKKIISSLRQQHPLHQDLNLDIEKIQEELSTYYKSVNEKEQFLTKRIRNFRYGEIIAKLILLGDKTYDKEIDDLSDIYKHEYEEIIEVLTKIEDDLAKLPSFKESLFTDIPINHQIEYPNQVITLLFQLHQNFKALEKIAAELEIEEGFKKIDNYAKFKNIINIIRALKFEKLPASWKTKAFGNYKAAKNLYPQLKQEVYSVQEIELYLDWDYQNLESFDVKEAIKNLHGTYFKKEEIEAVENIVSKQDLLLQQLRLGLHNIRVYNKASLRLKNRLSWDFNPDDDDILNLFTKLTDFLKNNRFYYKWLNINKYNEIKEEISDLEKQISRFDYLQSLYLRFYPSMNELDNNIANLVKMEAKGKKGPKTKGLRLEDLLSNLKELKVLNEEIEILRKRYKAISGLDYEEGANTLAELDLCYEFITSIENKENQEQIVKFLFECRNIHLTERLQEFNDFLFSNKINEDIYIYTLQFFPKISHNTTSEKQNFIQEVFKYLSSIYETNHKMSQILKESPEIVPYSQYLNLDKRLDDLEKIKESIRSNKDYKKLYASLYQEEKTNVNELGHLIGAFADFINLLQEEKIADLKFPNYKYKSLLGLINQTDVLFNNLTDLFKTYSRLFKDGIGGFYYDSLEKTINKLHSLMSAKEELIAYLDLTSHLQTLQKYKLFLLINLVIEGEEDLISLFDTKFFNQIYQEASQMPGISVDTSFIYAKLSALYNTEVSYALANLNRIQGKEPLKAPNISHRLDYKSLLNATNKLIFLSSPEIINKYIDISNFDLVLIDDAQMLHANEYHLAIQAKQVIICGEELLHYMNQTTLLSRMRASYLVSFNERFAKSPLQLSIQLKNILSPFYSQVLRNQGIEVYKEDIIAKIISLVKNNPDIRINIFVKNISSKKAIHEALALAGLNSGFNSLMTETLLTKNTIIVDLLSGYSTLSDINIIYLDEYYDLNLEFIDIIRLSNLLLPKEKLILYDPKETLNYSEESIFIKMIKSIMVCPLIPFIGSKTKLYNNVAEYFIQEGINVLGFYYDISLILEYNNKYFGVILYCDPEKNNYQLLESYRKYRTFADISKVQIFMIFTLDLYEQRKTVLDKIIRDIKDD